MSKVVNVLVKSFVLLFAISSCVSCQEHDYDYINDNEVFFIDNVKYYQIGKGFIEDDYFSIDFGHDCNRKRISFTAESDDLVDKLHVGQNIVKDIVFDEIVEVFTIYLGDFHYEIKSGKIIVRKVSGDNITLEFVDVVVEAEMINIFEEESYHTFNLKGKMDFEKY